LRPATFHFECIFTMRRAIFVGKYRSREAKVRVLGLPMNWNPDSDALPCSFKNAKMRKHGRTVRASSIDLQAGFSRPQRMPANCVYSSTQCTRAPESRRSNCYRRENRRNIPPTKCCPRKELRESANSMPSMQFTQNGERSLVAGRGRPNSPAQYLSASSERVVLGLIKV
jgi:hypothetical protein